MQYNTMSLTSPTLSHSSPSIGEDDFLPHASLFINQSLVLSIDTNRDRCSNAALHGTLICGTSLVWHRKYNHCEVNAMQCMVVRRTSLMRQIKCNGLLINTHPNGSMHQLAHLLDKLANSQCKWWGGYLCHDQLCCLNGCDHWRVEGKHGHNTSCNEAV